MVEHLPGTEGDQRERSHSQDFRDIDFLELRLTAAQKVGGAVYLAFIVPDNRTTRRQSNHPSTSGFRLKN
ncbi:hypothetical protein ACFLQ0_04485 [Nitrospinota bacterium]